MTNSNSNSTIDLSAPFDALERINAVSTLLDIATHTIKRPANAKLAADIVRLAVKELTATSIEFEMPKDELDRHIADAETIIAKLEATSVA